MRKRLLVLAVLCIFTPPLMAVEPSVNKVSHSRPMAGVAFAGHVVGGGFGMYCPGNPPECGHGLSGLTHASGDQEEPASQVAEPERISGQSLAFGALARVVIWLTLRV